MLVESGWFDHVSVLSVDASHTVLVFGCADHASGDIATTDHESDELLCAVHGDDASDCAAHAVLAIT